MKTAATNDHAADNERCLETERFALIACLNME